MPLSEEEYEYVRTSPGRLSPFFGGGLGPLEPTGQVVAEAPPPEGTPVCSRQHCRRRGLILDFTCPNLWRCSSCGQRKTCDPMQVPGPAPIAPLPDHTAPGQNNPHTWQQHPAPWSRSMQ